MKIYTKTGDEGKTSLVGGTRVSKSSLRVCSYGEVDELVAHLGVLRSQLTQTSWNEILQMIQKELMTVCAYLAADEKGMSKLPGLDETLVAMLENEIDYIQSELPVQKYFIVPGASLLSAQANLARCVCRRAERKIIELAESGEMVPHAILVLINRLSDYLYSLSRILSKYEHSEESYWIPASKDV